MGLSGRGRIWSDVVGTIAIREFFGLLEISDTGPEWHRRILGHGLAQYSGLYTVRAQPAATGDWAGDRSSRHDDDLFADWNLGNFCDRGDLRDCYLGSGSVAQPLSFAGGRGHLVVGDSARDVECKYWRQRSFSRQ